MPFRKLPANRAGKNHKVVSSRYKPPLHCQQRFLPLAILHIVVWLIHAVVKAFATALVDVFTGMTTALIVLLVVVVAGAGLASAFGLGGVGLLRRRRRRDRG